MWSFIRSKHTLFITNLEYGHVLLDFLFLFYFQFDGKLVQYFNVKRGSIGIGDLPYQRLVTISQVVTLPEFVARSERFDQALESGDIGDFCQQKVTKGIVVVLKLSFLQN